MTVAFTICANNYLAHAKTLALSFKKYHPEVKFAIALVDEINDNIDYESLGADEIIHVDEIIDADIQQLAKKFSIAELCTVVKPELIKYLYKKDHNLILYIDPDIKVYSYFKEVFEALEESNMVLTPHMCSPTKDDAAPMDFHTMRTGIYNLGFLALKMDEDVLNFIDWWDERVKVYGYEDLRNGFFYDQIWMGFAPTFLKNVCILHHLGYNVANWNLHERKLTTIEDRYYVNDESTPVRFFHFSHYKMENLPEISSYNLDYSTENRPDIAPIFNDYTQSLMENGYNEVKKINYRFGKIEVPKSRWRLSMGYLKKSLTTLLFGE